MLKLILKIAPINYLIKKLSVKTFKTGFSFKKILAITLKAKIVPHILQSAFKGNTQFKSNNTNVINLYSF